MEGNESAILKAAEEMVRKGGYNGFSFRNIADIVGIKSASVHYYFPTKEDLGAAVAQYYTDRFMTSLGAPAELVKAGKNPIEVYVAAFRSALVNDKRMCLCGILGAENDGLPKAVVANTKDFFNRNIAWLSEVYGYDHDAKSAREKAIQTLCLLEGAMITANLLDDINVFDAATKLTSNI